ncbi:MAG: pyridoxal phosphate-dependent aminotransferase family protein [Candidatus Neomarinimicrobiota bacterium]|jgi:8-amino-7-oxononanoate synthase|nr:pyridoxal phosphate-dependent aminotransferase family protein [Candidatus Neomarinimicrobiota bacterium]MDD3966616.1 pyridoxal phosphate-dependent aminotransferase family protein [Candidatus Neomarinimicrobiota bacterium]MDX9780341.1 pyridoxal phosphate-dependent aminotransferase family protein [bacterium]
MLTQFKDIAKQKIYAKRKEMFGKHPDVFTKMYAFTRSDTARALGYYPYYPKIEKSDATEVSINGQTKIMLGSNNYLGLTNHPKVIEAGVAALKEYGSGLTGSRLLNGNILMHDELERRLADFVHKESALVFSTGYGANLGAISTVCGPEDLIFSDQYNHASIVDGIRFSGAMKQIYAHNNMQELESKLKAADPKKPRFIVSDGVFSMEGTVAKLKEIVELSKKYPSRLMVDDAHSIGVLGPNGEGTAAHFGVTKDVDLIMGTFSKSLGCVGGFIAGEKLIIEYLKHHSRAMIFTASLPPSNVASVMTALEIIQSEPERRQRLHDNTKFMSEGLKSLGFDIGESVTPIIPVIIGKDAKTFKVWKSLMDAGVYTNPVVSPATPPGRALLRTSYMATHTREQLEFCLDMFEKIGKKEKVID